MNKNWRLLLLLGLLVCGLSACAKEPPSAGMANPMKKVDGPEAFEPLGVKLSPPEGAENAVYYIIGETLAHVSFTLDERKFILRAEAGKADEDISGVYEPFLDEVLKILDCGPDNSSEITIKTTTSGGRLATWGWNSAGYCLYTADEMSDEEISSLARQMNEKSYQK